MSITVRPEKVPPTVLKWRLLVLPFSLSRPADKHWGALVGGLPWAGGLGGPERRGRNVPAETDRLTRADVADYGNHGYDLVVMNYYFDVKESPDGTFTYGLRTLPQDLEYLGPLGSSAPMVIAFEYTCRDLEYRFSEPGKKHFPGTFSPKARQAIVGLVHPHPPGVRPAPGREGVDEDAVPVLPQRQAAVRRALEHRRADEEGRVRRPAVLRAASDQGRLPAQGPQE